MLVYATNVLWETRDGGKNWQTISPDLSREHSGQPASLAALPEKEQAKRRGAIYAVAASFKNTGTLWAGTDDGLIWITRDHGKNWKNITPPQLTPWSKVTQIDASHFDDNTAYVSVSRFRIDDLHPYIYRTHDGGSDVAADHGGAARGFAGEHGARRSGAQGTAVRRDRDGSVGLAATMGTTGSRLQYNLPHTSMRDLEIHGNDLIVATHGRSFWVLDDISPLRQMDTP